MAEHSDHTQGPNGHAEHGGIDVDALHVARGLRQILLLAHLGHARDDGVDQDNACKKEDEHKKTAHQENTHKENGHMEDEGAAEELLSPEDERKKKQRDSKSAQREADRKAGWVQCNVKTWGDPDARKLMSAVGLRTKEAEFRAVIWIILANPQNFSLAARVCRLTGIRRFMMRLIVGSLNAPPIHST